MKNKEIQKMKNAKRKRVWVTMYGFEGEEISVMLTKLERNVCNMTGKIWYIPERTFNQLLDDYITVSFQRPDTDTVTRLPYGIERVIVLRRDDTYHDIYVNY